MNVRILQSYGCPAHRQQARSERRLEYIWGLGTRSSCAPPNYRLRGEVGRRDVGDDGEEDGVEGDDHFCYS
jgi:hypothetical protein